LLPETRYSLIARLACPEDTETWDEFLRTYEAAILRYCRTKGLQDADAADVCQHVLIAVHQAAQNWQPSGRSGSFREQQPASCLGLRDLVPQVTQAKTCGAKR